MKRCLIGLMFILKIVLIGCASDGFNDLPPVLPTHALTSTLVPTSTPVPPATVVIASEVPQVTIRWAGENLKLNTINKPMLAADDRSTYTFMVQVTGINVSEAEGLPVYLQLNGSGRIGQTPVFLDAQGMAQTTYTVGESTDTSDIRIIPNLELHDGTIIRNKEGLQFQIKYEDIAIELSQCSSLAAIGSQGNVKFTVRSNNSVAQTEVGKYEVRATSSRIDAVRIEYDPLVVEVNQPAVLTWSSKLNEADIAEICLSLSERPTLAPQCLPVGWGAPVESATLSVGASYATMTGQQQVIDSFWGGSPTETVANSPSIRALIKSGSEGINKTVLSVQHDVISTWDKDLLNPLLSRNDLYASAQVYPIRQAECDVFVAPTGAFNIYYNINMANEVRLASDKSWLGKWIIRYPTNSEEQVYEFIRLITADPIRLVRNQPMTFKLIVDNSRLLMTEYDPHWLVHSAMAFRFTLLELPIYLRFYVHQDALDLSIPERPLLLPQPPNTIVTRLEWFNQEQTTNLTLNAIAGISVDYAEPVLEYPDWYLVHIRATLPKDSIALFERVSP